jgi:hypothetical protein
MATLKVSVIGELNSPRPRTLHLPLAIRECPKGDANLVTTKPKVPSFLGQRLSSHPLEVVE